MMARRFGIRDQSDTRSGATAPRVLHVIDQLGGGGAERLLWEQVRLGPADIEQRVVTVFPDQGSCVYAERLRQRGAGSLPRAGLVLGFLHRGAARRPTGSAGRRLYGGLYYAASLAWGGYRLFRTAAAFRPTVIHAHTFFAFPLALLLRATRPAGLVTSVPCNGAQMIDAGVGWLASLYARFHRVVDCFVTAASRSELLRVGVPEEKILWMPGFIDLAAAERVRADREQHRRRVRAQLGLDSEAVIALSAGRLHPSKGHLFALHALPELVRRCPGLHWVVLGAGPQREELAAGAAALGLSSRVHLLGFQEDLARYYAAADIYLRTPIYEAENLTSYLAMAMGLPVVGFDTGAESELINRAGHGTLVRNRDSGALAAAVIECLRRPDRGRAQGARGLAYASGFDLSKTVNAVADVYRQLTTRTTQRARGAASAC